MKTTAKWLAPLVLGVLIFAAWVFATESGMVGSWALPSPGQVWHRLVGGISDGYLLDATRQTVWEATLGCFFAAIIGVPVGFAIAHSKLLAASLQPYLAASQAIPAVAIAPLLVLWVGYGTTPIVWLCTIMVVFPIIINTSVGVRGIDPDLIGAARLDGAGPLTLMARIELPLAAPNILAGLRNGFTLSITGAVVGEMVIGGQTGLGIVLTGAQALNDVAGMFAAIIILAVIAIAIYIAIYALETRAYHAVSERQP
ncbi:ABC transporter permease [Trueperella bialowiezensis]|uniref:Glycine betaine/L-proline transport system permease protein proW n=1 Tax=Trueperella bialowiezensis TaxID=312285 RepID=A0A3S4Z419_9ACTO|nr:ABC transporter permease [Trueperella bialowiezensis]VEI12437.1 Glycine betaine/L-proline transport system permease protein proW [Trueperella bialowiezensis]